MHQLNLHNKVLSNTLSVAMQVSEDTVRRDLQELSEEGRLIKVHGGALSLSFNDAHFSSDKFYSPKSKRIIAEKAIKLIENGMFVLTSGGTTIVEMAKCLPPALKATFITGSIPAAIEYMSHPNVDLFIIGDKVLKDSKITAGAEAISKITQIRADLCILGINAIDVNHGITDNDWDVVQVKKVMIKSAQKVICLSIAEKINTFQPIQICGSKDIDILITELHPEDPLLKPYVEAGITVL